MIGVVVPVLSNFRGFAELMESIREPIIPLVIDNWNGNRGVARAWNTGIHRAIVAGCDKIAVLNDDVIFESPVALTHLACSLDDNPEIDLLTPTNIRDGRVPISIDGSEFGYSPDFSAFMIRPEFVDKFGWFDENIFPAYFEDNDMARRIKVGGGRYANSTQITMLHRGSQTQNAQEYNPVVPSAKFEEIRAYYISKWGGNPLEETFETPFNDPSKTIKDW